MDIFEKLKAKNEVTENQKTVEELEAEVTELREALASLIGGDTGDD